MGFGVSTLLCTVCRSKTNRLLLPGLRLLSYQRGIKTSMCG